MLDLFKMQKCCRSNKLIKQVIETFIGELITLSSQRNWQILPTAFAYIRIVEFRLIESNKHTQPHKTIIKMEIIKYRLDFKPNNYVLIVTAVDALFFSYSHLQIQSWLLVCRFFYADTMCVLMIIMRTRNAIEDKFIRSH